MSKTIQLQLLQKSYNQAVKIHGGSSPVLDRRFGFYTIIANNFWKFIISQDSKNPQRLTYPLMITGEQGLVPAGSGESAPGAH